MNFIGPILILLLNVLTNHTMLTRKKSVGFCIFAFVLNTTILLALMVLFRKVLVNPIIYKYMFYLAAFSFIIYIMLVFSEPFSIKLFTMFSTWVFSTILAAVSNMTYDIAGDMYLSNGLIQGIRVSLQIVLFMYAYKYFGKFFKAVVPRIHVKIIYLMSAYMFLALLLLIKNFAWNKTIFGNAIPALEMSLIIALIILGYIIVFYSIATSSYNKVLKQNVFTLEKRQVDMEKELHNNNKELENVDRLKDKIAETEMAFLQAQIKPHFLYNALNAIANVSEKNGQDGSMLILDLAIYLRGSLAFNNLDKMVTIEKELEFVQTYFNIEKARFGKKIQLDFLVEVPYKSKIPVFILQPLVENAVRHGISKKVGGGSVSIKLTPSDKDIHIDVFDNGVGIKDETIAQLLKNDHKNGGIGLINIHQRLMKLYGKGLLVESELNKGTSISFTVPRWSREDD